MMRDAKSSNTVVYLFQGTRVRLNFTFSAFMIKTHTLHTQTFMKISQYTKLTEKLWQGDWLSKRQVYSNVTQLLAELLLMFPQITVPLPSGLDSQESWPWKWSH